MSISVQPSSSSRRTLPIKRADAEPLSREDIQYDLLQAIFNDKHAVFTSPTFSVTGSNSRVVPKKLTFCELYTLTIITSPRCSKVLKEKMAERPDFAVSFAKISLLANVGRINTTMAFFPEMKTVLRSYHPIPSLQNSDTNLQDAPRIKNCLKACLLPQEVANPPTTLNALLINQKAGIIPTTSTVNLIFILASHSIAVTKSHFESPYDFYDLFLPVDASSASRARAFLWIMFHYLESPDTPNPFADEYAVRHLGKIPKLHRLTPHQRALENVDTEEELKYGQRMALYRGRFLQKQIASEERAKAGLNNNGLVKAFKVTTDESPPVEVPWLKKSDEQDDEDVKHNWIPHQHPPVLLQADYFRSKSPHDLWQRTAVRRTMLQQAWHHILTSDPLDDSEEEVLDEHNRLDYRLVRNGCNSFYGALIAALCRVRQCFASLVSSAPHCELNGQEPRAPWHTNFFKALHQLWSETWRIVVAIIPIRSVQRIHEDGIRMTKSLFAKLLVFICRFFAPTRFVVTFEGDGLKEDELFTKDSSGNVISVNLPDKLVIMANHQIYADWLYLWTFLYTAALDTDIQILLKKSLKWIPVIGWGMQMFHFIFLSRSWASDRSELARKLAQTAIRARSLGTPLAFLIFPEGTLVSKDTYPVTQKYAEKMKVVAPQHMLLPRSTGLIHCLRALTPQIPDLKLLDVTINYEGIPRQKYGQSYYTLRSIFMDGIPPPRIHIHLRLYDIQKDVPVGDLVYRSEKNASASANTLSSSEMEKNREPSAGEAAAFDEWVKNIWYEKDALYERCLSTGTFECRDSRRAVKESNNVLKSATSKSVEIPVGFKSDWHYVGPFPFLLPIIISCIIWRLWIWIRN